ncbi:N-acetyl sugar amidotransferase [Roseateles sp.]|uniref:N-acetyl sugar amidotransferase n=1 Tax=Roseateles sp. TaxID=1971397 RepID=UPI002E03BC23|nr:N-acetyl sugar amidotransferase [Roseateles sp.]
MNSRTYQICTHCVMDTTDPEITFDGQGVCNHCHDFKDHQLPQLLGGAAGAAALDELVVKIKEDGKNKEYDCIIGISGGIDSSYVAYRVLQLGLRPLAVHVDTGWNSELAVGNIEKIVSALNIDLHTTVIDWDEMRDLQLAFLRSGVSNCDVPQDHAFVAVLFKLAAQKNVRWIISGHNLQTESILPDAWGYTSIDRKHLRAIHHRFGKRRLKTFPTYSLFDYTLYWPYVKKIKIVKMLNFEDYNKQKAKQFLIEKFGWRDYGGKHYESRFTKFFQSYYLPKKFGFDKRRAHLASLVVSGQTSREQALAELQTPPYVETEALEDCSFIAKKLGITKNELEQIIQAPPKTYLDYPSNADLIKRLLHIKGRLARFMRRDSQG